MKNITVDGVEYTPVIKEPAKVGRWKPDEGEPYWMITDYGEIGKTARNDVYGWHTSRFRIGNVYQTEALAIRARDRQALMVDLQDFADQKNKGEELSDRCYALAKFGNKWGWVDATCIIAGTVSFRNGQTDAAIAHFGDRLNLLL